MDTKNVKKSANTTDENNDPTEGWTQEEKYNLLQILKMWGSSSVAQISQFIDTKSEAEIKKILEYYDKKAVGHPTIFERKKKGRKVLDNIPHAPLAMWGKFLTESLSYQDLHTETATALRLIAEFENHPSPMCTNNIDFKQIYNVIADALEGKCSQEEDMAVISVLEKCIVETAYTSKAFIRNGTLKTILNSINMSEKEITEFPRPTVNNELTTIRHLASQRTYNPLNIPEQYLKPTMHS